MALLLFTIVLSGCNNGDLKKEYIENNTGFVVELAGTYDSADRNALVLQVDKEKRTVKFRNFVVNKNYTLSYDGTSKFFDKYESAISAGQLSPGDIVDITFLKNKKKLNSLNISKDSWQIKEFSGFAIDYDNNRVTLPNGIMTIKSSGLIYMETGEGPKTIELNQITNRDVVSFLGVGDQIYSIAVNKGHGYLRLVDAEAFMGGWIEIGKEIISKIDEDMLYTLPEGEYDITISKDMLKETRHVNIAANREEVINLAGTLEEEDSAYGTVVIKITPPDAQVYIDGTLKDISLPVTLEYGIHQLSAKAESYKDLTQYIKVGQESAELSIKMEKSDNKSNETMPTPTAGVSPVITVPVPTMPVVPVTDNNGETVNGYKITVETPADTEIYMDGKYLGKTPISFSKTAGAHDIILRKEGYVTKTVRINVDNSERDETFSFADLEKSHIE